MPAPNKQQREVCWLSRDIYQQCIDRHRPEGETGVPSRCAVVRAEYEKMCLKSWVSVNVVYSN